MRRIMGYMPRSGLIGLIEAWCHHLLETSGIGASQRDTAYESDGVWGILPELAGDMVARGLATATT